MSENKTKPTAASVQEYIASRASDQQTLDCKELMALLAKITRKKPRMWGPSIVGYGSYEYTYESGRSGTSPLAAFAIRGRELVVYLDVEVAKDKALLRKLGKHRISKCCLYIKRIADVDASVLAQLVADSITAAKQRYGFA
ncbi:MAG TPA: DUF1801 domain-containing protein [Nannocystaceae bacterium]|nr:DUF1801 domain-containing protein [Nannocystaceae bacterium]